MSAFLRNYHEDIQLQIPYSHNQTVGYFDPWTNNFSIDVTFDIPGLGPNVTYTYIFFPPSLTYFTTAVTGVCYLFTTIVLLLFICYRNQPEIKAISVWLSLCILLGLLFYHIRSSKPFHHESGSQEFDITSSVCCNL